MLLNFVIVVAYSCMYAILGSLVLGLVPPLRVTLLNLIVFVLGSFAGGVGFLYASDIAGLQALKDKYIIFILLYFVAAALGGTLLVWLKMRFIKAPDDSRIL